VVNSLIKWIDGPFGKSKEQGLQLSGSLDGLLTEYIVLSEEAVLPISDYLSFEEAATLPVAALTAWNALTGVRLPQAGETILTLGSGGVSLFALQFAKHFGARVIATTSSEEKMQRIIALGADEVINSQTTPNWHEAVRELTGGRGVDLVVESTLPGTLERSIKATATGGQVSLIGWIPSPVSTIDIGSFFINAITLRSVYIGSRAQFLAMNHFISQHQFKPVIDRVFHFDDAKAAYQYYEESQTFGKVVISHS
jgi:NADPH:quinone reductase-like Zn-dependent oxidoreductase